MFTTSPSNNPPSLHRTCLLRCLLTSNQPRSCSGLTSRNPASFFRSMVVYSLRYDLTVGDHKLFFTSSMKMARWWSTGSTLSSGVSKSGGVGEMNLGQAERNSSSKSGRESGPPRWSRVSWSPYLSRRAVWIVSSSLVGLKATQMATRAYIWSFFFVMLSYWAFFWKFLVRET